MDGRLTKEKYTTEAIQGYTWQGRWKIGRGVKVDWDEKDITLCPQCEVKSRKTWAKESISAHFWVQ